MIVSTEVLFCAIMYEDYLSIKAIGIINNFLNLMNVPSTYQQVVKGLLIVAAVIIDVTSKKKKN